MGVLQEQPAVAPHTVAHVRPVERVERQGDVKLHLHRGVHQLDRPAAPGPCRVVQPALLGIGDAGPARAVQGQRGVVVEHPAVRQAVDGLDLPSLRRAMRVLQRRAGRAQVADVGHAGRVQGQGGGGGIDVVDPRRRIDRLHLPRRAVEPGVVQRIPRVHHVWAALCVQRQAAIAQLERDGGAVDARRGTPNGARGSRRNDAAQEKRDGQRDVHGRLRDAGRAFHRPHRCEIASAAKISATASTGSR